jgi:hypothetical protein
MPFYTILKIPKSLLQKGVLSDFGGKGESQTLKQLTIHNIIVFAYWSAAYKGSNHRLPGQAELNR